jgi:hypothetical protein
MARAARQGLLLAGLASLAGAGWQRCPSQSQAASSAPVSRHALVDAALPIALIPRLVAVAPSDPRIRYAVQSDAHSNDLVSRSDDGGVTWTLLGNGGGELDTVTGLAVDAHDPQIVHAYTVHAGEMVSTDGGHSFSSRAGE